MIKKKVETNNNFQKSIESTAKVISEKKNLSIFFGEPNNKNKSDIVLPILKESSELNNIKKIRGMTDSASLIKKYHDTNLHKQLSPSKEEHKKIFDELENMRCEVLGSFAMPGVKKNISDFLELDLVDKNDNATKISSEKT